MKNLENDPNFNDLPQEGKDFVKKSIENVSDAIAEGEDPAGAINFIIRHDKPKVIFNYERLKYAVEGVIDAPLKYLEKRVSLINQLNSTLLVDREKMTLSLTTNEENHFNHKIKGSLQMHPDFLEFEINDAVAYSPKELGKFFRMRRAAFDDVKTNQALVALLMNFEAKIDSKVAEKIGTNGDRTKLQEQVVTSNIPDSFYLTLPLFKGQPAVRFKVDVIVSPDTLKCELESPEAKEYIDKVKNTAVDDQLVLIKEKAPDLLIIEQ